MKYNKFMALCLVALTLGQAAALPQPAQYSPQYHPEQYPEQVRDERKFAEKPNTMKKVALDDLDDIGNNSIQEGGPTSFSWGSMLTMLMQMLLGQGGAGTVGPSKNDVDDSAQTSAWSNIFSVGLRLLSAILGGTQQPVDGIDKVDNQSSPMQGILTAVLGAFLGQGRDPSRVAEMAGQASQFINIVMNLLEALKTSFSHRSLAARSLGRHDTIAEAAVASISMLKGYVRTMKSSLSNFGSADDSATHDCAARALCEASAECTAETQGSSSIFCQLGTAATSFVLHLRSGVPVEALYEAGRRGRFGEDCRTHFMDCNTV